MKRRQFLIGAAALASLAQIEESHARRLCPVFCGGGHGAAGPLSFLRVVTPTNGMLNLAALSVTGTQNTYAFRGAVEIANDCAQLVLSFNMWSLSNSGELTNGNNVSILDCAIDSGTAARQVTFSASQTATLVDAVADFQCDAINPVPGKTQYTKGEVYFVKLIMSAPATTGKMPIATQNAGFFAGCQALRFDPAATTISACATPGAFTSTGTAPAVQAGYYMPIILGFPYQDVLSLIATGDSIFAGTGESAPANRLNNYGYFQRSLTDADGVSNPRPAINFSTPGIASNVFAPLTDKWIKFVKYANTSVNELGTNDDGSSFVTMTDLQRQVIMAHQSGGAKRFIRPRLLPNVTPATFATTAAQTPVANWGPGGSVDLTNAWFLNKITDGTLQAVLGTSDIADATIPTDWAVDGVTNNLMTADGKHPSTNGATIHGAALNALYSSFPNVNPTPSALPPVLNPYDCHPSLALSNGNLTVSHPAANGSQQVRATTGKLSGKWCWKVTHTGTNGAVGISNYASSIQPGNSGNAVQYISSGACFIGGPLVGSLAAYATGQSIIIAVDFDNQLFASSVNGGNWNNNVANNPAVGAVSWATLPLGVLYYPMVSIFTLGESDTIAFSGFSPPAGYSLITGGGV